MRTLHVRMPVICNNAATVAARLEQHALQIQSLVRRKAKEAAHDEDDAVHEHHDQAQQRQMRVQGVPN